MPFECYLFFYQYYSLISLVQVEMVNKNKVISENSDLSAFKNEILAVNLTCTTLRKIRNHFSHHTRL